MCGLLPYRLPRPEVGADRQRQQLRVLDDFVADVVVDNALHLSSFLIQVSPRRPFRELLPRLRELLPRRESPFSRLSPPFRRQGTVSRLLWNLVQIDVGCAHQPTTPSTEPRRPSRTARTAEGSATRCPA